MAVVPAQANTVGTVVAGFGNATNVAGQTSTQTAANIIREDLENVVYKISPLETPIFSGIGRRGSFESVYHEWPVVDLGIPGDNTAVEGQDASYTNTPAQRLANYAQINFKARSITTTAEKVNGAGDIQRMAKQVLYATQELKRDIEYALGGTQIARYGDMVTTTRHTASLSQFISAGSTYANSVIAGGTVLPNVVVNAGVTGTYTPATFSGGQTATTPYTMNGYVSVGEVNAITTAATITESSLQTAMQAAWQAGGNPTLLYVPGSSKIAISKFNGTGAQTSTVGAILRYEEGDSKKLVTAIDVYEGDFGRLSVLPNRFMAQDRVMLVDPAYAEIGWLNPMRNVPLARTGLAEKRMVSCEWGLIVGNPKAHAMVVGLK